MKRFIQKQVLELISTILEALEYVVSKKTTQDAAIYVLQDCYVAIEAVDNSLKENLSAERYSFYSKMNTVIKDLIESLSNSIMNHESIYRVLKKIKNQLNSIKKELARETEIKYEIVFMPYKISMWDSLESIWRAAKEDPKCECYVIPIPYYDRNHNGSLGQFHYEGKDFPNDVPITHYDCYDLSVRNPDVVYIHNPYDQYNYVTSVDPNYYSYELKKNVDMLVYVPYFVTGGMMPKNQMQLPIFDYIDKMVIQSNKFKQIYANNILQNKLIALGSPKVDRMIYYENHKPEIPKEWSEVIGDKKVIMYNVSISGILQYGIKALQKMLYVFTVFQKRNDVVLLWRPHPLIESTLKSMNPSLLKIYLDLKEQYLKLNIGIYDATPDVNASITLSDAYIGEQSSSIVHLFGVVGKPIFLTNMEINKIPTEDDVLSISFPDCHVEEDTIWFISNKYNSLCKMDVNSGKTELVAQIPTSLPIGINGQYSDVIKIEDKIIMLPMKASKICEYDVAQKTFRITPISDPVALNFIGMIHYKDSLFLIPWNYPAILQYDIKKGTCKYYKQSIKEFKSNSNNKPMFSRGVCLRNNLLLAASSIANKVLEFNMDTGASRVHTVGSEGINYLDMTFDGTHYWLIPDEGKMVIKWNYETGKTIEYINYPQNFIGETRCFVGIVCCGTYMLAFPRESNMIIKIDISTGVMSEFKVNFPYREGECKSCYNIVDRKYYFAKKYDDEHVVAMIACDNSLLIINTQTEKYTIKKCRLDIEDIETYISKGRHFGRVDTDMPYASIESAYLSLEKFINRYVISRDKYEQHAQRKAYAAVIDNMDGTCGEKVHQYIKEQLCYYGN